MSTTFTPPPAVSSLDADALAHQSWPSVLVAAIRAEWVKIRSVRSTMWSLLVTMGLTIGLGALISLARMSHWSREDPIERLRFDAAGFSMVGVFMAQLAIGVLGVIVMSSEYSTGQIRATFGALPHRSIVLTAKFLVFTTLAFVVGLISTFPAFFIGQAIFHSKGVGISIGDPGALRVVILAAVYLAALGALGLGLGAILRRTAGAIAALVGILLILPIIANFLPSNWTTTVMHWLPGPAGQSMFRRVHDAEDVTPLRGFLVLCLYAFGSLGIGGFLLRKRDA